MGSKVTPFLLEKWRQSSRLLDADKKGIITAEDFITVANNISQKTAASAEEAAKTQREWVKWYDILIGSDKTLKLNLEQSVNGNRALFVRDIARHIALNQSRTNLFDRLDLNKGGKIALDELGTFYEAVE